jgi:putative ABC transport system ATP-binding protein
MSLVQTENLTKVYGTGQTAVTALNNLSLSINQGEFVAVMGPSGCGKSTLLHLIGGLDTPTNGHVTIDGHKLSGLDDNHLTELRRRHIGFVFQFFNLIPVLTATENAALPLVLDGTKPAEANSKAKAWLERLGLADKLDKRPDQLSGGQQQRVAIARALTAEPSLVLADEPTGNLDSRAADEIAALLRQIADEWKRSVMMVTHDPRIAAYADRIIFLKDGTVVDDTLLSSNGHEEAEFLRQKVAAL